jgi:hypothetical protein
MRYSFSIYNPAFDQLREELRATETELALSLSLFILFQVRLSCPPWPSHKCVPLTLYLPPAGRDARLLVGCCRDCRPQARLPHRADHLHRRHDRLLARQLDAAPDRHAHHPGGSQELPESLCARQLIRLVYRLADRPPYSLLEQARLLVCPLWKGGSTPPAPLTPSRLADMFEVRERGKYMGTYYAVPLFGPAIGPLCKRPFLANLLKSGRR